MYGSVTEIPKKESTAAEGEIQRPTFTLTFQQHPTTNQTPLILDLEDSEKDYYKDEKENDNKQGTVTSGIINLSNTIIGAGMLGLPGAFGGTGFVGGTIFIVMGAAFSSLGLILLSKAAQKTGLPSSFYSVAREAVPQYTILIDLAVALKCFGVATGYLITIGDCMVDAFDHLLLEDPTSEPETLLQKVVLSRQFWIVGAVLAVLPTSFFQTLDELKKASALALVFVFLLGFGIVAYANELWGMDPCAEQEVCQGGVVAFTDIPTTLSKLPIFIFAFTCHQNIFPIVNEMQNGMQGRLNTVVILSIGFALGVFYLVAMEGYFTFGSNVRGDVLLNYPENANVTILRICIAVMLSLHYPLQLDPSRRCITSLVKVIERYRQSRILVHRHSSFSQYIERPDLHSITHNKRVFYVITVAFLSLSFCVAMVVQDLGVVLAMVGATGSTLVSYILPGLIYWKLFDDKWDATRVLACIQFLVGCLVMPIALYFVLSGKVGH